MKPSLLILRFKSKWQKLKSNKNYLIKFKKRELDSNSSVSTQVKSKISSLQNLISMKKKSNKSNSLIKTPLFQVKTVHHKLKTSWIGQQLKFRRLLKDGFNADFTSSWNRIEKLMKSWFCKSNWWNSTQLWNDVAQRIDLLVIRQQQFYNPFSEDEEYESYWDLISSFTEESIHLFLQSIGQSIYWNSLGF